MDFAVPAEDKPRSGGVTRVVLLLTLLFGGGSTDFSSSTSATVFLYRQSFCFVSPLDTVTTVALKLWTALVFTLVLSFSFVLAFLALGVFAFLAFFSPYTASISVGASPIGVEWLGCTVCVMMA